MSGKRVKYWILHCSATKPSMNVGKDFIHDVHIKQNGWDRYGYESIITREGERQILTPFDRDGIVQNSEMTWGAKGYNAVSIHTCLAGGLDDSGEAYTIRSDFMAAYTTNQYIALYELAHDIVRWFPWIQIAGHYHFSDKECPCFDVEELLSIMNIPDDNIYKL